MKKVLLVLLLFIPLFLFGEWSEEFQVNNPDASQDNAPEIIVDSEGNPWIFWYNIEGSYICYTYKKFENGILSDEYHANDFPNYIGTPFGGLFGLT